MHNRAGNMKEYGARTSSEVSIIGDCTNSNLDLTKSCNDSRNLVANLIGKHNVSAKPFRQNQNSWARAMVHGVNIPSKLHKQASIVHTALFLPIRFEHEFIEVTILTLK